MILPGYPRPIMGQAASLPEFLSASSAVSSAVAKPAGVASGDHMLALVVDTFAGGVTAPTGWTQIAASANSIFYLYSKVAGGSEPATYNWTTVFGSATVGIIAYRGGGGSNNIVGAFTTADFNNISTASSITPTETGVLLGAFANTAEGSLATPPSGMTQRLLVTSGVGLAIYELSPSPPGATGLKTVTWGASGTTAGIQVQIT